MSRRRQSGNILPAPDDTQNHYDTTDPGNALRFLNACGAKLRYVDALGWFVWDGKRFRHDPSGVLVRGMAIAHAVAEYNSLMKDHKNDYDNPEVRKFRGNKMMNRIRGMIDAAKPHKMIRAQASDFDSNPDLINVLNGTLNLKTGEMLKHDPSHLITKLASVEYKPDAKCPKYLRFLLQAIPGGKDVIRYVQRYAGYILCGETGERCFLILHGVGANGKSTLLGVWSFILGDYATDCPIEVFLKEKNDLHRTYIARLRGARLVVSSETEQGKVIRAARVKLMTGEDEVTANFMARDPFTFRPVMKLVLGVNYMPQVDDLGEGMWDRIRSIQDWPRIPPEKRHRRLRSILLSEREGIFVWMVRGYRAWYEASKNGGSGLVEPQFVLDDIARYRGSMDTIGMFFAARLARSADGRVERDVMRAVLVDWCNAEGRMAPSPKAFNAWMRKKEFDLRRTHADGADVYVWGGVSLQGPEASVPSAPSNSTTS